MNKKNNVKYLIIILLIIVCYTYSRNIRYYISGGKDAIIAAPDSFYFEIMDKGNGDLYMIYDEHPETYITIDSKYFNNNDTRIYVTGNYWNTPKKPMIKLNGNVINDVKDSNTGYAGSLFSDRYFSRNYHFYVGAIIEEDKPYEFYARVDNKSDSIIVIFTTKETVDGYLID